MLELGFSATCCIQSGCFASSFETFLLAKSSDRSDSRIFFEIPDNLQTFPLTSNIKGSPTFRIRGIDVEIVSIQDMQCDI